MKTTRSSRRTANPRRTTLAHLKDASELVRSVAGPEGGDAESTGTGESTGAAEPAALPKSTANPRRTVLNELPKPRTVAP